MKIIVIVLGLSVLTGCAIVPLACYDCYDSYYGSSYSVSSDNPYSSGRYPTTGLADAPSSSGTNYYGYPYYRTQYPDYYGHGYYGPRYPGYYGYRYYRPRY
ncbi:MAG TPA: hypothetical protein PKH14_05390 [Syntrophorhabdus sp.]|nr:hypothetical protein [Syntrophorhabdus sp.]